MNWWQTILMFGAGVLAGAIITGFVILGYFLHGMMKHDWNAENV